MLDNNELLNINGGASIFTATFFNSIARMVNSIADLGRSLGSALRRYFGNKMCSIS